VFQLQREFEFALAEAIARDRLPISMVEGRGFIEFLHKLNPRFRVPVHSTITRRLHAVYAVIRAKLKEVLTEAEFLALTTDMWTSRGKDAYCGVTGHWLDKEFNLYSCTLGVSPAPGSHTADNIAKKVQLFGTRCSKTHRGACR